MSDRIDETIFQEQFLFFLGGGVAVLPFADIDIWQAETPKRHPFTVYAFNQYYWFAVKLFLQALARL